MSDKILLGYFNLTNHTLQNEPIYLDKHKWDCGWYWGFGYLGNKNLHFHFKSLLESIKIEDTLFCRPKASELFSKTNISDLDWYVIQDLFIQAYSLKEAAEVYRHGGHNYRKEGITDILKSSNKAGILNEDLEKILNMLWDFICNAVNKG